MRKLLYKLNIQLFGDGGGDGGAASSGTATDGAEGIVGGEIEIPADIPEKARKIYAKAMQKRGKVDTSQSVATPTAEANTPTATEETVPPQKLSFKDLLKSDEDYKREQNDRAAEDIERMLERMAEKAACKQLENERAGVVGSEKLRYTLEIQSTQLDQKEAELKIKTKEMTYEQVMALESLGCDIVRITAPDIESVKTFERLKALGVKVPLVADIHFNYEIAVAAAKSGADKIRINPGNIGNRDKIYEVVKACRECSVPIRIGVNSGSLEKEILAKYGSPTAEALAESAINNAKMLEQFDYSNIVFDFG